MTRRHFFRASVAAAGGSAVLPLPMAGEPLVPEAGTFHEAARDLPLVNDVDVIVCGGGPAGVSAAISAARAGAMVRLFEWRGCLGGVWTAGLLGYLLDFDKPGFARELLRRLEERGARRGTSVKSVTYEPEGMKLLLEDL